MRPLLAAAVLGLVLAAPAFADDPVRPEIGAGPHRDSSGRTSGEGKSRGDTVQPVPPGQAPGASTGPSQPVDAERDADERKATESKEKMKQKPGYKEDAPSPRASHTSLHANN